MTREEFDTLQPYEKAFEWAMKGVLYLEAGQYEEIAAIYGEPKIKRCNNCRLEFIANIASSYFKKKEEIARREAKKAELAGDNNSVDPTPTDEEIIEQE